ncbi:MAG: transglutaminase family protein [Planctomycetaceae bacterium]
MRFKRFGQDIRLTVRLATDETPSGEMRSFELTFGDSSRRMVDAKGKVDRGRLTVETTISGRTTRSSKVWTPDMRSPAYELQLYRTAIRRAGDVSRFKMYRPEENRVISVVVNADGIRPTRMLDRSRKQLLRTRTVMADLPTVTSFIDSAGNVVKTEADLFGQKLVTYTVDRDEALKAISGRELDQAVQSLIPTDVIKNPHRNLKLTYKITLTGTDLAKLIPSGPTQTVQQTGPNTVLVTVVVAKPAAGVTKGRQPTQDYLTSNRYLQTQDQRVIQHARRAAGGQFDPWKICVAMERYVFQKLTQKNFSTALATAADVAQNLEGDCTEHAVLLAAMVRTRKIPSRLVGGLVYLERKGVPFFGGHMWTEVFVNGQWFPLDATLGLGSIGVGHLKLATSSFADDAPIPVTLFLPLMKLIGHMKIQVQNAE